MRDSQRSKVYRAEKVISGKSFKTIDEIQSYVEEIVATEWFKNRFKIYRVTVYDGRGRRSACGWSSGGYGYMKFPKQHRRESVVLHELAHCCQPTGTAGHGKEFCSIFVKLVHRFMGVEAFVALTNSFRENRIKYLWDIRNDGEREQAVIRVPDYVSDLQ